MRPLLLLVLGLSLPSAVRDTKLCNDAVIKEIARKTGDGKTAGGLWRFWREYQTGLFNVRPATEQ